MSRRTLPARYATRIDREASGCWRWTGRRDGQGYAKIRTGGRAAAPSTDRYSPAADDERRYVNAIARRNSAWSYFRAADDLLDAARLQGLDPVPYMRNYNAAQHEYEWAERDLVSARVAYRGELRRREVA